MIEQLMMFNGDVTSVRAWRKHAVIVVMETLTVTSGYDDHQMANVVQFPP